MNCADSYLAELLAEGDERVHESAEELVGSLAGEPEAARAERLLRSAMQPLIAAVLRFGVDQWPGVDASDDASWAALAALARRTVEVQRDAGAAVGVADLVLGVLDWVDQRIGSWEDRDFGSLVRARLDELLDARRRGGARGRVLRAQRGATPLTACPACWALRHPADHYFRRARANTRDQRLAELLDGLIEQLACAYQQLRADHAAHDEAGLIVEVDVLGPLGGGWAEPVRTVVRAGGASAVAAGGLLGLRLVADPERPFNGTLIAVDVGERWLLYADRAGDGTIIPLDGTRRLQLEVTMPEPMPMST